MNPWDVTPPPMREEEKPLPLRVFVIFALFMAAHVLTFVVGPIMGWWW